MEKILAIFDSDITYASRFMEYFQRRRDFNFEISAFSKRDSLEEFVKQHNIEILLFGEGINPQEIPKDHIKYIYGITQYPVKENNSEYPCIYKYQPAGSIMSQVILDYNRNENIQDYFLGTGEGKIITVFAPIPEVSKWLFSWSLSLQLSEKNKVLFIPLDSLPAPELYTEEGAHHGLSEFIYYLKENNPNLMSKMKALLRNSNRLDYLSGLSQGMDLFSLNNEEVGKWLEELKSHTEYEVIVFYISHYSYSLREFLKKSATIFAVLSDTPYERAVIKEWERQMEFIDLKEMLLKVKKIIVPKEECTEGKFLSVQELPYSSVGAIARQLIMDM
jgi:hypothetical protein